MSQTNSDSKIKFLKAVVISKEKIAGHTYHLKVRGDDIKSIDYTPGMHMKVAVQWSDDSLQDVKLRSYSIWDFDSDKGTIDIAVCTHSNGLGSKWIEEVEAGDDFYFFLKKTLVADNSAGNYFFIGDISTLGHFYKVRRALSPDKKVFSFVSGNETDFFSDLDGSKPFDFYMLPSDKHLPAPIEFLKEKITETLNTLHQKSAENTNSLRNESFIAYIGGDARVCAELTAFFTRKLGWHPSQIKMKSFWNPDKVREE
ncbi:MAG: SIP domain-containing protein [Bacteroidetes bacterium]|nr:SIP domain-containing protein [Bacteroidota bacterium]